METKVAIIGAGPSGLILARMLYNRGLNPIVLENRNENYLRSRIRTGILDFNTIATLKEEKIGDTIDNEGLINNHIKLVVDNGINILNLKKLTDNKHRVLLRQTTLVNEILDKSKKDNLKIIWEAKGQRLEGITDNKTTIHYSLHGKLYTLVCDYVVGCDGWMGICRPTTMQFGNEAFSKIYPFSWYGFIAEEENNLLNAEVTYAFHKNGFAFKMPTTKNTSRYYLQCENGTDPDAFEDNQLWDELDIRMNTTLKRLKIIKKEVHTISYSSVKNMQYGNLFLAGDAAHLLPITGGKGLNIAVSDVKTLADAFVSFYRDKNSKQLENYSKICLENNRNSIEFTKWMTTTFHQFDEEKVAQTKELYNLMYSEEHQKQFASNYVTSLIN